MSDNDKAWRLRAKVQNDKDQAFRAAVDLADRADHDQKAAGELEFALGRVEELDRRLSAFPETKVVREPEVYERNGPHSFFRDLIAAMDGSPVPVAGVKSPTEAQERLGRHVRQQERHIGIAGELAHRTIGLHGIVPIIEPSWDDGKPMSQRALSSGVDVGGGFVPPRWMVEQFASVSRAAAPLAKLVTKIDLPPNTLELRIPRFDSAAGVIPMSAENVDPPEQYSGTDELVAKVATFAGDTLVSQQLYERGGIFSDEVVLRDFAEAYGEALEFQLVNGTGLNGQLLGLLNVPATAVRGVPGRQLFTYTIDIGVPSELMGLITRCAARIGDERKRAPSACLMRPSRWFWLAGTHDINGEPNVRPGTGVIPDDPDLGPYGPLSGGLPVYLDATLPNDRGTGENQDVVVEVRAKDILLLEDPAGPRFTAYVGSNLAGQMTVVLQWHFYVAAFTNRYPSGIGTIEGTGLATPEGY